MLIIITDSSFIVSSTEWTDDVYPTDNPKPSEFSFLFEKLKLKERND